MGFIKKIKKHQKFKLLCQSNILSSCLFVTVNNISIDGRQNELFVHENNIKENIKKLRFDIRGDNNKIFIDENIIITQELFIRIYGANNEIRIGKNFSTADKVIITMIKGVENGKVIIGNNVSMFNVSIKNYDNDSMIEILDDCMFSYNVNILNTDEHAITQNGKIINKGEKLYIGKHVWLGWNAVVMKNSYIPNGSIVGRNALVVGKLDIEHAVYGGVPARLLKENVEWHRSSVNDFHEGEH